LTNIWAFLFLKEEQSVVIFSLLLKKMQSRLASWKHKMLNKPGRVTLESYIPASIPSYYMQVTCLPQNICDSIDQTTLNFIWRDNNNIGIRLVGWEKNISA